MPFDYFKILEKFEAKAPGLSRNISVKVLGLVSPFNSHLKARILDWSRESTTLEVRLHRGVKNHVGGIHAGAIFTLGETCAGLIIIKNFSFNEYRPIMSDVTVHFSKQARGTIVGVARVDRASLSKVEQGLKKGLPQMLELDTEILNSKNELIASVKTKWQIKSWDQIKTK
jgi:acyl-coenzyme A thioesterase PaaI-like protein